MADVAAPKVAEEELLRMTAEVVAAYVRNNSLPTAQLAEVINAVYKSLRGLEGGTKIILDERPESINDGYFVVEMNGYSPTQLGSVELVDYPGIAHGLACGFGFADGHSEIHKWVDAVIRAPLPPARTDYSAAQGKDVRWLQDRCSHQ